jgi:hypothetical protein
MDSSSSSVAAAAAVPVAVTLLALGSLLCFGSGGGGADAPKLDDSEVALLLVCSVRLERSGDEREEASAGGPGEGDGEDEAAAKGAPAAAAAAAEAATEPWTGVIERRDEERGASSSLRLGWSCTILPGGGAAAATAVVLSNPNSFVAAVAGAVPCCICALMSLTFSVACASTLSSAASAHLRKFIEANGKKGESGVARRARGRLRERKAGSVEWLNWTRSIIRKRQDASNELSNSTEQSFPMVLLVSVVQ